MENASKALLFAGGVLISIIIISMLVLMYNSLTSYQQTEVQNEREAQILQFNQQYEGYVRDNVRGNELFSLISKAIDYNNRESSLVSTTDQFEPMEIKFNLKDADLTRDGQKRIFTSKEYTFRKSEYSKSLYNDTMGKISGLTYNKKISDYFNGLNSNYIKYDGPITAESFDRLVTGYDKIFISNEDYNKINTIQNKTKEQIVKEKAQLFLNFNSAVGVDFFNVVNNDGTLKNENDFNKMWKKMNDDKTNGIKNAVNTYYEYIQFKRAIFKCNANNVRYSSTGRIVYLEFEFTGKYN